jgi:hypothetical protein
VHDLSRFLRDLPLALGHLAAAEAARRRVTQPSNGPQAAARTAEAPPADEHGAGAAADESAGEAPAGAGSASSGPDAAPAVVEAAPARAGEAPGPFEATTATGSATEAPASLAEPAGRPGSAAEPVSPRVELRAKLLAAAPQLGRAAQTYRRNVATVRRATAPRRAPGPWRSDREVLEQARRAVEFARQIFDAYAEAWADAPLPKNGHEAMADEADRFLAWTQLIRYVELARVQPPLPSSAAPAPKEPSPDAAASSEEQEAAAPPEADAEENRSGPAAG